MLPWSGKNIYFLGFMGSGKSRVGRAFANMLGWPFLDTDDLIEERAGKKIGQIFAHDGEKVFRQLETDVIKEVSHLKNNVIALGGGAVIRDVNWEFLNSSGVTICLAAPVELLAERIGRNEDRPLMAALSHSERQQKIKKMLQERQPYYDRAQFQFESTNDRSIQDFINHIFETLLEQL
ncbi:shikimate kinase [candidate division KSB1 bacterium]|nr:shikimate kinase [candidate division KSB1 bacterium]RQW05584.1 MAG: shikimate kinase [candidate division KSB1 bacterium]